MVSPAVLVLWLLSQPADAASGTGDGGSRLTAIFGLIGAVVLAGGLGVSVYRASVARRQACSRRRRRPGHPVSPERRGRRPKGPGDTMIDHFGINCADLEAAKTFYDRVLATLGHRRVMDFDVAVGYGTATPVFWISRFEGMGPNREVHVAFTADSVQQVQAFHEAAVALGAETLHEPRLWPEYHAHYYGAFVRDPDGNNVEAVCHTAPAD